MAKKYKLTGFARFLIFFVIVTPLVYFGVTYFQGDDPFSPMGGEKSVKVETPKTTDTDTKSLSKGGTVSEVNILKESIRVKDQRIKELEREVEALRQQVRAQ